MPGAHDVQVRSAVVEHAVAWVEPAAQVLVQALHEVAASVPAFQVSGAQGLHAPTLDDSPVPHAAERNSPGPHVAVQAAHELSSPVPP